MASTSSSSTSSTSTWFSATLTSTMLPFSTFSTSSFRRTCFWVVVFMRLEVLCVRSSATFYGDEADRIDDHLTEAEQERQMYPGRASAALFSGGEFPGASTEEGGREGRQPSIRLLYQQPPVGTVVPRLTLPPAACAVEDGPHVVTVHGKPDKRSRSCNPALKEALSRSISDEKWQELEDERSGTARTTRRRLNGTEEASVPAQKETSSSLVEDTANVVRGPTRLGTPFVRVGDEWVLSGDPYAAADSRGWRGAENDRVSGHYTNPASSPQASPRGTLHMSAVLGTVLSEIEKDGQQKAAATQETGGLEGGEDDMEEGSTQGTKKLPTLRKRTRTDSQSTLSTMTPASSTPWTPGSISTPPMNLLRRFVSSEMFEDGDPLPTASVVVVDQQDKVIRDGQEHGAVVVLTFTHSAQSKAEKLKATSSPPGCEAGNNSCDEKDGMVVVRLTSRNVDDSSVRDQISSAHRVVVVVPSTASLRDACYESLRPLFAPNPLPAETAEQVCLRELDMVKQTLTQLDQSNSIIVSEERFLELASYTAFESVVSSTVASLREALENLHVSYRA